MKIKIKYLYQKNGFKYIINYNNNENLNEKKL